MTTRPLDATLELNVEPGSPGRWAANRNPASPCGLRRDASVIRNPQSAITNSWKVTAPRHDPGLEIRLTSHASRLTTKTRRDTDDRS